ncbi:MULTISPECIES: NAD-dependent succinate-semialdehyde dehydrogenase [Burkholderia]|uniref:NAD-dependent succinate-semialdehyde dehydrogenase n=1 Tax=Burkholderia TaxID=32008 RepID=UPI00068C822F|nr:MULTISPECIES: NAD-dependent succinate-semialdehyde dehydrogenase [Burkholderia]
MSDVPTSFDTRLSIAGRRVDGRGERFHVFDPATGAVLADAAGAHPDQVDEALQAAHAGFRVWRDMAAVERASILTDAGRMLGANLEQLARQLTLEQGKPLAEARAEWQAALETLDWYANEGLRAYGRIVPSRGRHVQQLVERDAVGPVAAFAPWNFPALTPMRKIAGSLAAGCSCILKAPEEAPMSSLAIAHALARAGLPDGVLSVVFGDAPAIAERLLGASVIRMASFTGSTPVGSTLAVAAGRRALPLTLELGGHAPVLVFPGANLDRVFATAVPGKFRNAGQICVAPTRFIVHRSLYESFASRLREFASDLQVGSGLDERTRMGPLATRRRLAAMDDLVKAAREEGAEIFRAADVSRPGFYWAPTVVTGLKRGSTLLRTEPFGPIAPCISFDEEEEALALANDVPYGLAAYLFTESLSLAKRATRALEAGMVGVNTTRISLAELPFGGVKESGYGAEGGMEGLQDFMVTRSVSIDFGD